MNAALHGLLPALTTCLPGSVIEERYLSSPIPSLTHFSHHVSAFLIHCLTKGLVSQHHVQQMAHSPGKERSVIQHWNSRRALASQSNFWRVQFHSCCLSPRSSLVNRVSDF